MKKAFSLLELIIALTLIGIIMAILINIFPKFNSPQTKWLLTKERVRVISNTVYRYINEIGVCPNGEINITDLESFLLGNKNLYENILRNSKITCLNIQKTISINTGGITKTFLQNICECNITYTPLNDELPCSTIQREINITQDGFTCDVLDPKKYVYTLDIVGY